MSHRVAVMQPYVFPYVGYFGLVQASDSFVFYDDVAHRPRGWVHRNRILLDGHDHLFTVPLAGASQNVCIVDTRLHDPAAFRVDFLRLLAHAYRRAPHRHEGLAYVEEVLAAPGDSLAELAIRSVTLACARIGLERPFLRSSRRFAHTRGIGRTARLVAITRALGGTGYVNSAGGRALYEPADFADAGLELAFVEPVLAPYAQVGVEAFVPGLSIIDLFMHLDADGVRRRVAAMAQGSACDHAAPGLRVDARRPGVNAGEPLCRVERGPVATVP